MRTTTSFTALDHIPDPLRLFAARRAAEITGLTLVAGTGALALALLTWSVQDPSLNHATGAPVHNLLGIPGAVTADVFMQMLGLAALALLGPPAIWGWRLLRARRLDRIGWRILFWLIGSVAAAGFAAVLPVTSRWPLPTGLGGVLGDALLFIPKHIFGAHGVTTLILAVVFAALAILALAAAVGPTKPEAYPDDDEDDEPVAAKRKRGSEDEDIAGEPGFALVAVGGAIHGLLSAKAGLSRMLAKRRETRPSPAPWQDAARRVGPSLDQRHMREDPNFDLGFEPSAYAPPAARAAAQQAADADADAMAPPLAGGRSRVTPGTANLKSGQRLQREIQPSMLEKLSKAKYQLPPLLMLSEPKRGATTRVSEEALQQNARLLEGVLGDFGVRGEIINVRPGPVVTLYELEPAPGIKSSRVIGLADDIARSMSALSARVAVVPGRNVIGIELPNQTPRKGLSARAARLATTIADTAHSLPLALGKDDRRRSRSWSISRACRICSIAGTTGSGKSVAINTMILSLLYRLQPDQCRLIMVDPKMLELSVYDGIPHLLTPVVTDPKKAVVALKWAVREMEDRYKKMSKLGVRNIDGYNARVAEAARQGREAHPHGADRLRPRDRRGDLRERGARLSSRCPISSSSSTRWPT